MSDTLPEVRGRLVPDRALSDLTWLRVGGPADLFFQPADLDADRRLRAAKPFTGRGEAAGLRHRQEAAKQIDIQIGLAHHPPSMKKRVSWD